MRVQVPPSAPLDNRGNVMEQKSNLMASILAGIISSVIVLLVFQPAVPFILDVVSWIGKNIYSGINNAIYENAAFGGRDVASMVMLIILFSVTIGVYTATVFLANAVVKNRDRKVMHAVEFLFKNRYVHWLFIVFSVISMFFVVVVMFIFVVLNFQLNTSFDQRITALRPEIDDRVYYKLRADWAKMKNRADFEKINIEMDNMAKIKGLTLPESLVK